MYRVKPGRGPSLAGGIGFTFMTVFAVFWTIAAISMGAPWFFSLSGVGFFLLAMAGAAFHFYNAFSPNPLSQLEITGPGEEPDPLDRRPRGSAPSSAVSRYCPYCGTPLGSGFEFCPQCGKDI